MLDNALISNLKGRVSKVLNFRTTLLVEELSTLEGVYRAIDKYILSNRTDNDTDIFKSGLCNYLKLLQDSKKSYIKEHIVPLMSKVGTRKWSENE